MRRAFTLIELLVIIGIIATMVTVSVVSVRQGQGAARLRGSARDIFAVIRHARSVALVTEEPSIITYSTVDRDGEVCAKIEVISSKKLTGGSVTSAETLSGERINIYEDSGTSTSRASAEAVGSASAGNGIMAEDILFAPVSEDVLQGVRLKVLMDGEDDSEVLGSNTPQKFRISAFSNVDYLLGQYNQAKAKTETEEKKDETEADSSRTTVSAVKDAQEPVQVVWQVNGRCDPHRVWVYLDGESPEAGLCIVVDMFGAAKILGAGEREDD